MKIAILGWGSLVWDPRDLAVCGEFSVGGPVLPIEFSRISGDGRLTLVVDPLNGKPCQTRFVQSAHTDLDEAKKNLRDREGTNDNGVGWANTQKQEVSESALRRHADAAHNILEWATKSNWDAVAWTALGSNFDHKSIHSEFSVENAIAYLHSLSEEKQRIAFDYINKAPDEIETPLRQMFVETFHQCP